MNEHSDSPDDQSGSRADASEHRADVAKKRADVSEKRADVSEKRADVSELRQDASDTRQDASDVRQDDRVTDIDERFADLRKDYAELLVSSETVTAGLGAVEKAVNADRRSRERRTRWLQLMFVVSLAIGLFGAGGVVYAARQRADDAAKQQERRVAFCRSIDDIGSAVRVGAKAAGEATIKTFLDPSLHPEGEPPPDPAILEAFVTLYRQNTAAEVDTAVAAEITRTKDRNGFTDSCEIVP